tara:strand:+ start:580 stop:1845 length:1266 start_codon:yes stop_codon:yes gene_type:complete
MKSFKRFIKEGIEKRGDKFVVTDSSGDKILGTHGSRKKALKQLAAVEISKKKKLTEQRAGMLTTVLASTPLLAGVANAQHKVKRGDTLSQLAAKHNISTEDLAAHNQITDPDKIQVGQVIKFPSSTSDETPAPRNTSLPRDPSPPDERSTGILPAGIRGGDPRGSRRTTPRTETPKTTPRTETPVSTPSPQPKTPTTPAATPPESRSYKVASGDQGMRIAKAQGVSWKALQDANPNTDWNKLQIGSELNIPGGTQATAQETPKKKAGGPLHSGCVGELCDALGFAETGPYQGRDHGGEMRNLTGSTALTRYQILKPTSEDFRRRRPGGFTPEAIKYAEKIYDLDIPTGGSIPLDVIDHDASRQHAQGIVAGMIKDMKLPAEPSTWDDSQMTKFIKRYRGVSETKDPKYYEKVRSKFKELSS